MKSNDLHTDAYCTRFALLPLERARRMIFFTEMVVLFAVSHNCIDKCLQLVTEGCNNGSIDNDFVEMLKKVFQPIASCDGENWQARTTTKKTDDDLNGLCLSPNFLSLFLEKSAYPTLSVCSPPVNHRLLRLSCVWEKDAIEVGGNPGIVASMLGIGPDKTIGDITLAELDYHFLPYKVMECDLFFGGKNPTEGDVYEVSKPVFSHENEKSTDHVCVHATLQDLRELVRLILCGTF